MRGKVGDSVRNEVGEANRDQIVECLVCYAEQFGLYSLVNVEFLECFKLRVTW